MVEQTTALDQKASDAVSGLLSGQGVGHSSGDDREQKANMAFELALQVRNKAVGPISRLMGMQF